MATKKAKELSRIKPGSPEMESLLSAGYPDIATREHAKEIIEGRKAHPELYPYELAERAKAFLSALDATPRAVDTDPGVRSNTRTG